MIQAVILLLLAGCSSPAPGPQTAPSGTGADAAAPGAPPAPPGPVLPGAPPGSAPPGVPPGAPPGAPPADAVGRFGAVIPEDFPDFHGGIDGTEFVPDPFFYGEESWDGLQLRLQLYLLYNHKDLARLALKRGDLEAALGWYDRLLEALRASPIDPAGPEPVLVELHRALVLFAERARVPLLIRLDRIDAAREALAGLALDGGSSQPAGVAGTGGSSPADRAWSALMQGALARAGGDRTAATAALTTARDLSLELLGQPAWQPASRGAAHGQLERHRDRLDRLLAYARWSSPLSSRQVWGTWGPEEAEREVWARAIAAAMALERQVPSTLLVRLKGHPGLMVDANRLAPASDDPLVAQERAERALRTTAEVRPRTSVEMLQGMPTGDSFVDLLGEPGAPPVGTLKRLSITDPEYRAVVEAYVHRINGVLEAGRPAELTSIVAAFVAELEAKPYKSRYYNLKRLRNEAIRLQVLSGSYDAALETLAGFYPLGGIDYRCPNRTGILTATKGRILLEAGRLEEAGAALEAALEDTRRWMGYLERYRKAFPARRGGPGGPGGPGQHPVPGPGGGPVPGGAPAQR